mgnify:CR=1 FL=1
MTTKVGALTTKCGRPLAAAGLFLAAFGLTGLGFGLTFLRAETATPLMATLSFLVWGLAGLAFIGAARLSKGE